MNKELLDKLYLQHEKTIYQATQEAMREVAHKIRVGQARERIAGVALNSEKALHISAILMRKYLLEL